MEGLFNISTMESTLIRLRVAISRLESKIISYSLKPNANQIILEDYQQTLLGLKKCEIDLDSYIRETKNLIARQYNSDEEFEVGNKSQIELKIGFIPDRGINKEENRYCNELIAINKWQELF